MLMICLKIFYLSSLKGSDGRFWMHQQLCSCIKPSSVKVRKMMQFLKIFRFHYHEERITRNTFIILHFIEEDRRVLTFLHHIKFLHWLIITFFCFSPLFTKCVVDSWKFLSLKFQRLYDANNMKWIIALPIQYQSYALALESIFQSTTHQIVRVGLYLLF